jgi:hypothetical protein
MDRPITAFAPAAALFLSLAFPTPNLLAAHLCCSVVSIDKSTGVVTLRDNGTGKLETVTVHDPGRLARLSVGQRADHGLQVRYCSIQDYYPCSVQSLTNNCQPCASDR